MRGIHILKKLLRGIRQKRHHSGPFYSYRKLPLMLCARTGRPAGHDLAFFGDKLPQFIDIFVIYAFGFFRAERADLFLGPSHALAAFELFIIVHIHLPPSSILSEWKVVFIERREIAHFVSEDILRLRVAPSLRRRGSALTLGKELHFIRLDFRHVAFFTVGRIVGARLYAPENSHGPAFCEVFTAVVREAAPGDHGDKIRLFFLLAASSLHRHGKVAFADTAVGRTELRVSRKIAYKDYFVHKTHPSLVFYFKIKFKRRVLKPYSEEHRRKF
jgi:hypothetical protein